MDLCKLASSSDGTQKTGRKAGPPSTAPSAAQCVSFLFCQPLKVGLLFLAKLSRNVPCGRFPSKCKKIQRESPDLRVSSLHHPASVHSLALAQGPRQEDGCQRVIKGPIGIAAVSTVISFHLTNSPAQHSLHRLWHHIAL